MGRLCDKSRARLLTMLFWVFPNLRDKLLHKRLFKPSLANHSRECALKLQELEGQTLNLRRLAIRRFKVFI
ncbi:hypothetical protein CU102_14170 [Phyllobacterium brassicacearum]|uniref:Uncharacterized protein n=1 Tax=Phyllobacterium brassicacearum TaxID=314235 RepID=A0A2P7BPM8_9HYPH|nr:hypothetical protein CU102_14170 [Phyllobacterium brassicacearum]